MRNMPRGEHLSGASGEPGGTLGVSPAVDTSRARPFPNTDTSPFKRRRQLHPATNPTQFTSPQPNLIEEATPDPSVQHKQPLTEITQITHIGLKHTSEKLKESIQYGEEEGVLTEREKKIQELKAREVTLSSHESDRYNKASAIRDEYFREKMRSLGFVTGQNTGIFLVSMDPHEPKAAGSNMISVGLVDVVTDREIGDPLNWQTTAAHETSHAHTVKQNTKFWKIKTHGGIEYDNDVGIIRSLGLSFKTKFRNRETLDETRLLGGALENGFAQWDASDVYRKVKHLFPQELTARHSYMSTPDYSALLPNIRTASGFPIEPDLIEASIRVDQSGAHIDVTYLHALLAQQICRTIGDTIDHNLTGKEKMLKGREFFDKARMTNPKDGWKKIVQVFGADRAKRILAADDQGNYIIEALHAVIQTQVERGI